MSELIARRARECALASSLSNDQKNSILLSIHSQLASNRQSILTANKLDLSHLSESPLSARLDLTKKFDEMLAGILVLISLPDPTNHVTLSRQLSSSLQLYKVTCPVGVLLVIFEARPEVIIQVSCLSIKSGNAVILKGGKEAHHTNIILAELVRQALEINGVDPNLVQLVSTRDEINTLLQYDQYIDLVIPRGSKALVTFVKNNTRIQVLGHADGICTVYVDESANIDISVKVIVDGKVNYPAACNATEKVLIHENCLDSHLVPIVVGLLEKNVKVLVAADLMARVLHLRNASNEHLIEEATEVDFETEFLNLTISINKIPTFESAISEINTLGSHHTDAIVTANDAHVSRFMTQVDSANVFHNCSTRFSDGYRYGFGGEIGVSTNKIHSRGPVGLDGLVIYKYRVYGDGHCVEEFQSGQRQFERSEINLEDGQKKIDQQFTT